MSQSDTVDAQIVETDNEGAIARPTDNLERLQHQIQRLRSDGYNVLAPTTYVQGDHSFEYAIKELRFDSTTERYENDDFYQPAGKNGGWAPAKPALQKIAAAFGIRWGDVERVDNFQDPNLAVAKAKAIAPDPTTGRLTPHVATKQIDLREGAAETAAIRERYRENGEWKTYDWGVDGRGRYKRDLRQKRQHISELAATGAKLRLIREATGVRQDYSDDEIRSPFAVVSVVSRPESEAAREQQAREAAAEVEQVYGETADQIDQQTPDDGRDLNPSDDANPFADSGDGSRDDGGDESDGAVSFPHDGWRSCVDEWNIRSEFPEVDAFCDLGRDDKNTVVAAACDVAEYDFRGRLESAGYDRKHPLEKLPETWIDALYDEAYDQLPDVPF